MGRCNRHRTDVATPIFSREIGWSEAVRWSSAGHFKAPSTVVGIAQYDPEHQQQYSHHAVGANAFFFLTRAAPSAASHRPYCRYVAFIPHRWDSECTK